MQLLVDVMMTVLPPGSQVRPLDISPPRPSIRDAMLVVAESVSVVTSVRSPVHCIEISSATTFRTAVGWAAEISSHSCTRARKRTSGAKTVLDEIPGSIGLQSYQ